MWGVPVSLVTTTVLLVVAVGNCDSFLNLRNRYGFLAGCSEEAFGIKRYNFGRERSAFMTILQDQLSDAARRHHSWALLKWLSLTSAQSTWSGRQSSVRSPFSLVFSVSFWFLAAKLTLANCNIPPQHHHYCYAPAELVSATLIRVRLHRLSARNWEDKEAANLLDYNDRG